MKKTPIELSLKILNYMKSIGCQDIVLCPGGRNAPFVEILSKSKIFNTITLFEERSAGFYALGLIKKTKKPVAVITTSGTAVAELMPSIIESHYQGLPLVVITADRPKYFRESGAPQSINQNNLFDGFVQKSFDIDCDFEVSEFNSTQPLHLNVCFDEPLMGDKLEDYNEALENKINIRTIERTEVNDFSFADSFIKSNSKPLIILGALSIEEQKLVLPILKKLEAPIYAEGQSGLKFHPELTEFVLKSGEKCVSKIFLKFKFDSVIRIGGIPTMRLWRDLENKSNISVLSFSNSKFSGLARDKREPLSISSLNIVNDLVMQKINPYVIDLNFAEKINKLLLEFPNSEQNFVHEFSKKIKEKSTLFLANSLPIREWDFVALPGSKIAIQTMRGVNGIDGNIAYYLGLSDQVQENYCLLGDLTTLYDLSSGFIYNKYLQSKKIKFVIINNGGGKIFKPLFDNPLFENNHDINFSGWAKMFNLNYKKISSASNFEFSEQNEVLELVPNNKETELFNQSIEILLKDILHD